MRGVRVDRPELIEVLAQGLGQCMQLVRLVNLVQFAQMGALGRHKDAVFLAGGGLIDLAELLEFSEPISQTMRSLSSSSPDRAPRSDLG